MGVRERLFIEDEIFEEFAEAERRAAENLAAKNQVMIDEKDRALKEKEQELKERDKALAEQAKALSESDDLISRLRREIERLKPPTAQELPAADNEVAFGVPLGTVAEMRPFPVLVHSKKCESPPRG